MEGRTIAIIVVVLLVIAGGWYLLSGTPANAPTNTNDMTSGTLSGATTTDQMVADNTPTSATVTFTDTGFSPASVTIPEGGTVTFVNDSSANMWVASAQHPTHTVYNGTSLSQHCPDPSGTAFDECKGDAPGATYSFTFTKVGSWKYHDHLDASKFGEVVVTAAQ